jgi:hypothetical protein
VANHSSRLQEALLLGWQPVDTRCQDGLYGGWHLDGLHGVPQMVGPPLALQDSGLHQGADALLQEEGIALRTRNEQVGERLQAGVVPEQGVQERLGAHRRQRVKSQLCVIGLAAPAVLVLGTVVDEQQELGRGKTRDQAVKQGLSLGVDPVQILADQKQGLHLAFAQQHALERREGALAALGGIKLAERAIVGQDVQEREQRWDHVLEGRVQRQDLPGQLGPDDAGIVVVVDMTVAFEQVKHGKIGRRLAIGHGGTLDD